MRTLGRASLSAAFAFVCGVWLFDAPPAAAQVDAGLLARVHDREIASAYDASSGRTAITLTLVLPDERGAGPQASLMFTALFKGRDPGAATPEFSVRTHF